LTHIKICGITNVVDAQCVAKSGAHLLGFVFYPPSKRYITPDEAAIVAGAIRQEFGARTPSLVGVFVDEPVERIRGVAGLVGLDLVQLHGSESAADVRALYPCAFKAIRPRTLSLAQVSAPSYCEAASSEGRGPQILVDAFHPGLPGGTGLPANFAAAHWLARRFRVLLAGGLTPDTVASVIDHIHPWGVDVSSGVEFRGTRKHASGVKDHDRICAFVRAVRAADAVASRQCREQITWE